GRGWEVNGMYIPMLELHQTGEGLVTRAGHGLSVPNAGDVYTQDTAAQLLRQIAGRATGTATDIQDCGLRRNTSLTGKGEYFFGCQETLLANVGITVRQRRCGEGTPAQVVVEVRDFSGVDALRESHTVLLRREIPPRQTGAGAAHG